MFERYRITIAFEADRDMTPGWGHQPKDWIDLATANFVSQSHYHTSFEVMAVEKAKKIYTEGKGYSSPDFGKTKTDPVVFEKYIETLKATIDAGTLREDKFALKCISEEYNQTRMVADTYKNLLDTVLPLLDTVREIYNKPHATIDELIELAKQTAKDTDDLVKAEFGSDDDEDEA